MRIGRPGKGRRFVIVTVRGSLAAKNKQFQLVWMLLVYTLIVRAHPVSIPVKNANYDKVVSAMNILLDTRYADACSCKRCLSDIAAMALNILPPHYFVDREDCDRAGSPWIMVEHAVIEAIGRVREQPRHKHNKFSDENDEN